MGEGAADFFGLLSDGPARTWSAPARRILTLRERYATADVDAALGHAARYGALGYDAVERILEARHRPRRLDEWVAAETARRLHGRVSTAITSNIELSEWGRYLGDALITRAILDRIVMNALRLRIDGPSYRQQVAEDRAKARAERRSKTKSKTKAKANPSKAASSSKSKSKA